MKLKLLYILVFLLLFSAACSKQQEVVNENVTNSKEENIEETNEEEPIQIYDNMYPLTGLGTNNSVDTRAVAVMINNHPKARPQSGLYSADVVYELLAEGNVTRFLAIFQSEQPETIGPVRSARDYYIELSKGFNSLYVAHGWSPEAKRMLEAGEVDSLNGLFFDGTLFWRSTDRVAPHNSYISFENIEKGVEKKGYDLEQRPQAYSFLTEDEITAITGDKGESVNIAYDSSSTWTVKYVYNKEKEKYERYSGDVQTADKETATPVLIDNVFVVEMDHKIIDSAGRRKINVTSGGKGFLMQKGVQREVEWQNIDGRIIPFKNGEEVGFVPGKTWINIVPSTNIVSFENY